LVDFADAFDVQVLKFRVIGVGAGGGAGS